jgi:hypothetical protein
MAESNVSVYEQNENTYEVNSSRVPDRLNPVVLLLFTRLMICGTFKTTHKTVFEMLAKLSDNEYKSAMSVNDVMG